MKRPTDPVEAVIYDALAEANIKFKAHDRFDFHLPYIGPGLCIECKRYPTPRILDQIEGHENVIVIVGLPAAKAFAELLDEVHHSGFQLAYDTA